MMRVVREAILAVTIGLLFVVRVNAVYAGTATAVCEAKCPVKFPYYKSGGCRFVSSSQQPQDKPVYEMKCMGHIQCSKKPPEIQSNNPTKTVGCKVSTGGNKSKGFSYDYDLDADPLFMLNNDIIRSSSF